MRKAMYSQMMKFLLFAQLGAQAKGEEFNHKEALKGSEFEGINFSGGGAIHFPTRSQKIKAKRLAKRGGR